MTLFEDVYIKRYAFALHKDLYFQCNEGDLVVVNHRFKENRILGVIDSIAHVDEVLEQFKHPTAEVVGIVDCSYYEEREYKKKQKKKRLLEILLLTSLWKLPQ